MSQIDRQSVPIKKLRLGERSNDAAYWRAQSPQALLTALEQIRREYHGWKYGAEPRFQRFCAIVKR